MGDTSRRGIVVGGPREVSGEPQYRVQWDRLRRSWHPAAALAKQEPHPRGWASRDEFLADLLLWKYFWKFSDVLFSIGASGTQFLVYQFKPVVQFVRQPTHGLLIADEVGLGKTIEAALIAQELLARGSVERLLVVCPANLRSKWRSELLQRFGIELQELRARHFEEMQEQFDRDGRWRAFFGVTSLEGLRMTDFERTLVETGVPFDLVIVDEAHHLRNPATRSFSLGEVLSDQADHMLLLSATPIQTSQSDLLSLLRLVEPAEFQAVSQDDLDALLEPNRHINAALAKLARPHANLADVAREMRHALETEHGAGFGGDDVFMSWLARLERAEALNPEATVRLRRDLQRMHTLAPYYTRTRKREVEETVEREARVIRVVLTPEEQEFYDAWVAFLVQRALARSPDAPPGFTITQLERTAASSLRAAHARMDALIGEVRGDDDYEGSDSEPVSTDERALVSSPAIEEAVRRLESAASQLPARDSKLDRFIELVEQLLAEKPDRKMLVFTFFRSPLRYLASSLRAAGIECASIWGDDPPERRADIIDTFREEPGASVLVSTEVGSEGLDFQFCDVVVNYDLPWNPMRVEQRIGRIDRFGQRAPQVVVASFFAAETIDTRILERLYERIGVFERSIGELEPILGPEIAELQADAFTRGLTAQQQEQRTLDAVLRIERRRQDLEEFESARAALMGQGDLLSQDIEDVRSSGRYVSPEEARAVVQRWLQRVDPRRSALKPTRRERVFDLEVSSEGVSSVHRYMTRQRMGQPDALRLLQRVQEEHHAWVTFDSELSQEFPRLPFLHIGHPLVLAAIDELQGEAPPDWIARLGSFALPPSAVDARTRSGAMLAIYRLGLRGLESQERLLPISLAVGSREHCDDLDDVLLGALSQAEGQRPPALDEATIQDLEDAAFEYADARRRDIEEVERGQLAGRIAVRQATLRRTYDARMARAANLLAAASDERIRRLYEGRIRNLRTELEQRVRELDETPEPSAELDLLSVAIFACAE
ncbi:MAG: SNF2-related protein [Chloroflexi bacterium]|nr:SNF2-related protein [Chloroflexota bacterium]